MKAARRRVALRGLDGHGVLRRHRGEGDAHDRVGAGGEDLQALLAVVHAPGGLGRVGQHELHAVAAPDPVALHLLHLLGPAEAVEGIQQLVGVLGDAHVPHRDLALLDQRAGAPAAPVDHLLVGEHGHVHRVPVHQPGLLVDDALLPQAQEEPLVPAVVGGIAGGELARPVERPAHRLALLAHVVDVLARPLRRRDPGGHGGVLRGQPERVPAHGHEDVVALHAHEVVERVVDGVVAHVPHVQLARGVREHRDAVVLGLGGRVGRLEGAGLRPFGLHGGLDRLRVVLRIHRQRGGRGARGQMEIIAAGSPNP